MRVHLSVDGDCAGGGNAHDCDLALIHIGALSNSAEVRVLRMQNAKNCPASTTLAKQCGMMQQGGVL